MPGYPPPPAPIPPADALARSGQYGRSLHRRTTWAVWAIAALCILAYCLSHIAHWHWLETTRLAWRGIGRDAAFRTFRFWAVAPVATLLHTGLLHLAANLWCLATLGAFLERRQGPVAILLLWIVGAWTAMGVEILVGGVGRIGLSAVTYTWLGVALRHWREAARAPPRRYTAIAMLALLVIGALEALGMPPPIPEIAHSAHAAGLLTGWLIAPLLPWRRSVVRRRIEAVANPP